ncbi:pantothenate transporter [Penicillium chermesinum]|uniref:Pantothenate transporter n=1 Tax=Penicillium chermesinum TaxID=63820 RepID=A0A9W9NTT1_9EURO|nr:pantothenate transporter [Penicillium chermesinum]KAJ5226062.1 pantothenate transporter [Penicillium chermesinum]
MGSAQKKLAVWLWGPDPSDRRLLAKLDVTLLPYFSLIWFLFGVTRASYSSAYISGMKEALNFQGKDYNYMNTAYLVVYAVFQMPGTSLLTIARPKYDESFMASDFVERVRGWIFGHRIVSISLSFGSLHQQTAEPPNGTSNADWLQSVGAQFILGSWYKKSELGMRTAVFCIFGHIGTMAGGWIQAGLLHTLQGRGGLPAWKWIFIIVSVMTIPVALFGWVFIPDLPEHRSAWYLTAEQREHAFIRLGAPLKQTWDLSVFRRVLLSWQFWLLPFLFMLYSVCVQMLQNNVMAYWMASRGYSTIQQNNYPTAIYAAAIFGTIVYAIISDKIQSRWEVSVPIGLTFIIGSAILVSEPSTDAGYFVAFYLSGTTFAVQAIWYSWLADVTSHDVQLRAITTGFMNSFDFAFVAWWPLVFFPVTDAPNFHKGYVASLVTGALTLPFIGLIAYLEKRDTNRGLIKRVPVDDSLAEEDQRLREDEPSQNKSSDAPVNTRTAEVDV